MNSEVLVFSRSLLLQNVENCSVLINAKKDKDLPEPLWLIGRRSATHQLTLPDHGYGASVSRGVSVYLRNPSLMDYYSFNRPRRDGGLSWSCWLTDSGRFTHKVHTAGRQSSAG